MSSSQQGIENELPLSVRDACARLWTVHKPDEVVTGLRELHESLLHDSVSSYDPSDVFLAIQAVSLRFQQEPHDTTNSNGKASLPPTAVGGGSGNMAAAAAAAAAMMVDNKALWAILQESMWTVAALARACVGKAWWYQALYRRRFRNRTHNSNFRSNTGGGGGGGGGDPHRRQTTPTTLPDDSSSNMERSSTTSSGFNNNNNNQQQQDPETTPEVSPSPQQYHHTSRNTAHSFRLEAVGHNAMMSNGRIWFPPIPEILPAAMLRFAAKSIDRAMEILTKSTISTTASMTTMTQIMMMNLVEAQLVVIQQLCCAHHGAVDYDRELVREWNIPGAHEAVGRVLAYALTMVCTGRPTNGVTPISDHHDTTNNIRRAYMMVFIVQEEEVMSLQSESTVPANNSNNNNNNDDGNPVFTIHRVDKAKIAALPPATKDQWKHILLVTRATTDLLFAGWRPLREEEDVILALLVIASRGINLDDLCASPQDTSNESREERLVASSCAAEALSALLNLTSRGLIPLRLQNTIVRTALRLHAVLEASINTTGADESSNNNNNNSPLLGDCPPDTALTNFSEEEEEVQHQVEFFASQRESCLRDTLHILWSMLSDEVSAEESVGVYFSIIDTAIQTIGAKDGSVSPLVDNKLKWNDQTQGYVLADCAVAIRILSGALWGSAPYYEFTEISMLRIFWHASIEAICSVLRTIHAKFVLEVTGTGGNSNDVEQSTKSSGAALIVSNYFTKQIRPLVVDAIAALERAVTVELKSGSGILSAIDWDCIVDGMGNSVMPWFDYLGHGSGTDDDKVSTDNQIRLVLESLLLCTAELLANYVRSDSAPLMDYKPLRTLLLLLVRASFKLDERSAEVIDLSVMRAWARFGFFPYRLEGWSETATEMLQEAFSRKGDGTFVHSAVVRLEALELLTSEEETKEADEREINSLKPQPLLSMTQYMRDLYQEVVSKGILPILRMLLIEEYSGQENSTGLTDDAGTARIRHRDRFESTAELELYAIKLSGRLFFSLSGDRHQRSELVTLLQSAATKGPSRVAGADVSVRLEALMQLETCLVGIFRDRPQSHECIPRIVDALCVILRTAVTEALKGGSNETSDTAKLTLRILCRLQLHPKNKLAFILGPARTGSKQGGKTDESRMISNSSMDVLVAPFVRVCDDISGSNSVPSDRTTFSFETITEEIFLMLSRIKTSAAYEAKSSKGLFSSLRKSCYGILSRLLISGVSVKLPSDSADVFSLGNADSDEAFVSEDEMLALILALSLAMESMFATKKGTQLIESENVEYNGIQMLVKSCQSPDPKIALKSCRSLFYILVFSEGSEGELDPSDICNFLLDRLDSESALFPAGADRERRVLSLLALFLEVLSRWPQVEHSRVAMRSFKSCLFILSKPLKLKSFALHLALRCILVVVRQFTPEEVYNARHLFLTFRHNYTPLIEDGDGCFRVEESFSPSIIQEALNQQSGLPTLPETHGRVPEDLLSTHQSLTIQTEKMGRFLLEAEVTGNPPPCAAWLCEDNVILTCRLGSSSSRYCGYVEVVLRSPLVQKRKLIPIPGKLTLDEPEFPLQLVYAPGSRMPAVTHEKAPQTPLDLGGCFKSPDSSAILDRAQSLLDRFDAMFTNGVDSTPEFLSDLDDDSARDQAVKDEDSLLVSIGESFLPAAPDSTPEILAAPSEPQSGPAPINVSNPDSSTSAIEVHTEEPPSRTLREWLIWVFGWVDDDPSLVQKRLENHLQLHKLLISTADDQKSSFMNYQFRENHKLSYDSRLDRAITILDRTTPSNTYKVGLLYHRAQPKSCKETNSEVLLLNTMYCSPSFHRFASQLGSMTPTRHLKYYSAGLDVSKYESDGRYTLAWSATDCGSIVVFHVVNLMPPGLNGRKRHIGNDNVLIVFVDETTDDQWIHSCYVDDDKTTAHGITVVSGQFNFATIFVRQLPKQRQQHAVLFRVSCRKRGGLSKDIDEVLSDFAGEDLVSEEHVADFVRSLAMRIDLACRTVIDGLPPPTNCLERCRQISEMKRYAIT